VQVFTEGHAIGGPVPSWPAGAVDPQRLTAEIAEWASSPPMRELAAESGWPWPPAGATGNGTGDHVGGADAAGAALVHALAERSVDWDFRGRAAAEARTVMERGAMPYMPAVVNGRTIQEAVILAAAAALGLVTSGRPGGRYDHVVVLSGAVRGCVNRATHAARLLADGVGTDSVVALGAHRPLGAPEREQAVALGLGEVDSESGLVLASMRQAFGLGEPDRLVESAPDTGTENERLARSARHTWHGAHRARPPGPSTPATRTPSIEVVTVPSERAAEGLRANTATQLRHWAPRAGLGPGHRVLLVTTQIYVPYQHLVGIDTLALATGCAVDTCGVDAATGVTPTRTFTGTDYLQELRSALLAARSLVAVAGAVNSRR
jgi:hypothetical protein